MAYRTEKNKSGKSDIVIDGFEKGIMPSPYLGISNILNLNTNYYPGVAYVNYKRTATTNSAIWYAGTHSTNVSNNTGWVFAASGSGTGTVMDNPAHKAVSPAGLVYILDAFGNIWKQSAVNSSSFNQLADGTGRKGHGAGGLSFWNNYLVVFGSGLIEFCGDGTGDAGVTPANWNIYNGAGTVTTTVAANVGTNQLVRSNFTAEFYVGDPVTFTTTGTLPNPLAPNTTYYIINTTGVAQLQVSLTPGGSAVTLIDAGTGTHTMNNASHLLPLGNSTNMDFLNQITAGDTTATIVSYTNPYGDTVTGEWQGASGQYNIVTPNGNNILATFTRGSATVTFLAPAVYNEDGIYLINLLDTTASTYKTYVSKVDGNLYFANSRNVGRILAQNTNTVFNPGALATYVVSYSATALLQPSDQVVDMVDLQSTLVIAGNKDVYPWDYVSPSPQAPAPVGEQIVRIENVLNNLFVTAGQKGNIYTSNGYSAQLFFKIPDYIAGVFDPVFTWGDTMVHRSKLYLQILAQNTSGTNVFAGIFSIIVSPLGINDVASGLVMEAQNSYGLTPSSGAIGKGLLIDNSPSSTGYDSYYSAWSNGAALGGIDYNDTTPWQNYEPTIETDIIPIGNILDKNTFGNIEFKLDRPMVSGDAIRIYWRPSLSDSYDILGTTTSTQLSDYYSSKISQAQWAQFKIQFKCASSGSSFVPLREIRLHTN